MERTYLVTLLDRACEVVVEVTADSKKQATEKARLLHPRSRILFVEKQAGS